MNKLPHFTDAPFHPGEHLKDAIDELGISQTELASRIGLSRKVVCEIINGKAPITAATAISLERVLGTPAHVWNNLQQNYELNMAYLAEQEKLKQESALLNRFPIKEMTRYGWIRTCKSKIEKVQTLYQFFGVASLNNIENSLSVQFRKSVRGSVSNESVLTWLRQGEKTVKTIKTHAFDKTKLQRALPALRALTITSPDIFRNRVKELCAESGVAVGFIPELPKTGINGAAFWLNHDDKAAVLLSLRFKTNDHLWFSFFMKSDIFCCIREKIIFWIWRTIKWIRRPWIKSEKPISFPPIC